MAYSKLGFVKDLKKKNRTGLHDNLAKGSEGLQLDLPTQFTLVCQQRNKKDNASVPNNLSKIRSLNNQKWTCLN